MKSVFEKSNYRFGWHDKKLVGVIKQFFSDLKCCWQRITKGYCYRDLWSIDYWFLKVMPDMLQDLKDTRHGSPGVLGENYSNEAGILVNDTCHQEWDEILDKMIFLFREADEEQCLRKNLYDEEYSKAFDEFEEKYGFFGEKLSSPEEIERNKKEHAHTVHFMDELPEYKDIHDRHFAEDRVIEEYRTQCKDEAFALFAKWFYYLWD